MPFYTKPLSQLDTEDLQELLSDRAVENARLEFKLLDPPKEETLKKLSSFANTFGGYMLVGAKADSKDGRLLDLPGVDTISGYKQKIVDWCFAGADPPLTVEVSDAIPTPKEDGKVCYAIHVPESDVAPHFLNGRKGVWVRTDEFSANFKEELANDAELRHLLDRRQLIRERRIGLITRAQRRLNAYLDQKHRALSGIRTNVGPLLELCVVPRFPVRQLCPQKDLEQRLQQVQTQTRWRGNCFPVLNSRAVSQHESRIVLDAAGGTSIFEADIRGTLFYATTVHTKNADTLGIHTPHFIGSVLLFVRHASLAFQQLGYSGPIAIQSTLSPLLHIPWFSSVLGYVEELPGSALDDSVSFPTPSTTEELRKTTDAVALEIVRTVLYSVNRADLAEGYGAETLLRMGYEYNAWPTPPRFAG
jgi:hypothetical protein